MVVFLVAQPRLGWKGCVRRFARGASLSIEKWMVSRASRIRAEVNLCSLTGRDAAVRRATFTGGTGTHRRLGREGKLELTEALRSHDRS
jgi:hypothetical protein